jgi:hypothetical protein
METRFNQPAIPQPGEAFAGERLQNLLTGTKGALVYWSKYKEGTAKKPRPELTPEEIENQINFFTIYQNRILKSLSQIKP